MILLPAAPGRADIPPGKNGPRGVVPGGRAVLNPSFAAQRTSVILAERTTVRPSDEIMARAT